jgi:hypothetical protein
MKVYQVVRRGTMWHVHMPDASSGIPPSADKLKIVSWACETAKSNNGTVHVRDGGGAIEMIYRYVDGAEYARSMSATRR